ncbi:MAG: Tm-1-like ATP-binding domain-containing protein [Verrucomicrobiales bacterium]
MATIAVLGTYDSKGHELEFVARQIAARGHVPLKIDVGTLDPPVVTPDVPREAVLDFSKVKNRQDRGESVAAMAAAAPVFLAGLVRDGRIDGVISLGGGGGTAIGTAAMRALPIGFPKVMVSTLASGNTAPYVGTTDIVMFPSIVDVAGLNRISRLLFSRAAGAICGMVETEVTVEGARPLVVASMFGNTTACVTAAKVILEAEGMEVLVFHATGTGGRTMEAMIGSGLVAGVLDVTTTEWADEWVGGILGAGPTRLEAAGRAGVPAVVAPGCLDMVNFGEPSCVPERFAGRTFYHHNPQVTLMRTTPAECAELGRILAEKVNAYTGPVTVLIPRGGVSVMSAAGGPFYDPDADAALFEAIRSRLSPRIPLRELDCPINDPAFARACAEALLGHLRR